MIASVHVVGGASSIYFFRKIETRYVYANVLLCIFFGVLSHLFLDAIPHGEYPLGWSLLVPFITLETVFSIFLVMKLNRREDLQSKRYLIAGIFGGVIPDFLWVVDRIFSLNWRILAQIKEVHIWFHLGYRFSSFPEVLIPGQVLITFMMLCFVYGLSYVVRNISPAR